MLGELSAASAAEAGNLLCEANPLDQEDTKLQDAQAKSREAQDHDFARKLLAKASFKDYPLRINELLSQPIAIEEELSQI